MAFGPVDPDLDLVALEERVLARWRDRDVTAGCADARKDGEPWIFYEGPPTANGRPGLHHVWARVFKDLYPRFQTMRGRSVPRKGGWDCHGLPVELEIEKELGLHSKHEIEAYGIAEFNQHCRDSVQRYVEDWSALTGRSGVWIDTEDAYWTLSNDYIESVWWLRPPAVGQGPALRGPPGRALLRPVRHRAVLPRGGPARVYRDVVDPSVYVRFPLTDGPARRCRPPGVDDHAVDAHLQRRRRGRRRHRLRPRPPTWPAGRDLVLAESRLGPAGAPTPTCSRTSTGDDAGRLALPAPVRRCCRRRTTGPAGRGGRLRQHRRRLGHRPPRAGVRRGRRRRRPGRGAAGAEPGRRRRRLRPHACRRSPGRFVKDADRDIIADLAARGLLVGRGAVRAQLPPLLALRHPAHLLGQDVVVRPHVRRMRDELLARERDASTGTPSTSSTAGSASGSRATSTGRCRATATGARRCRSGAAPSGHDTLHRLGRRAGRAGRARDLADLDLHRPYVDDVTFPCPRRLRRHRPRGSPRCSTPGSTRAPCPRRSTTTRSRTPSASSEAFPADFICEAIDQTRGWFYSLLAVNTLVFDSAPYRNVVCLGHIVDADGQKMSKSQGQRHRPVGDLRRRQGADALRWYFFSVRPAVDAAPGVPTRASARRPARR